MTPTPDTTRVSLLVLIVVTSVALAGVSVGDSGAAIESTSASLNEAIEYGGNVELALDSGTDSPIEASNVDVWVDGERASVSIDVDGTDGRVVLSGLDDVDPTQSLVVAVDQAGDLQTGNVSVTVTGGVQRAGGSGGSYPGTPVAYVASAVGVGFDVSKNGSWQATRSTGDNSRVYVLSTDDGDVGTTYLIEETSGGDAKARIELRDLDLTAEADATSIGGSESVTVSVTSTSSDRPVLYEVVDLADGTVVRTVRGHLDGDGTHAETFDDLQEGSYEIRVVDANSGITTSTAEITVGSGVAGTVEFPEKTVSDQRGDVVELPVSFAGDAAGGQTRLSLSDLDGTFRANVTLEDTDGDGAVLVHWNTAASTNGSAGLWVTGGSVVEGPTAVEPVSEPVAAAEYSLSAYYGGSESDIATVFVEERSTTSVDVLTAPSDVDGWDGPGTVREAVTADSAVALDEVAPDHDWVVVRINATGLEGYVETAADVDGANGLSLTVEESEETVATNGEALAVDVSETTLVAAGNDDTYYVAFKPEYRVRDAEAGDRFDVTFSVDAAANPVSGADETVTTAFEFVAGTASFDTDDGEVVVSNEAGATVTGTSTFAPGTTLTVELRKEGGTSPFVQENDSAVVGPEGQWRATFDLSDRPDDQTFTAKVSKEGEVREAVDGRVGTTGGTSEPLSTDETTATTGATRDGSTPGSTDESTGTTEKTPGETETPTSTGSPGYGVLVGVVALAAGALLVGRGTDGRSRNCDRSRN